MMYLEDDKLIIQFPELDEGAGVRIDLKRTLRIPDNRGLHALPPEEGNFPLRHIEDYDLGDRNALKDRGGLIMPMFQADAMYLNFDSLPYDGREGFPVAVKIATGKVCAITGQKWTEGLNSKRQNYVVVPEQEWLDGYCIDKGSVRQFVAAPLGDGATAEEQLHSTSEVGGIQIQVFPMKREVLDELFPREGIAYMQFNQEIVLYSEGAFSETFMGISAGGRMQQEIFEDPYGLDVWDQSSSEKCFITIANAEQWIEITDEAPPLSPVTAEQYTAAGLPWFSYFDDDQKALDGAKKLGKLKSFQKVYANKGKAQWFEETLKHKPKVMPIGKRRVDSGKW